VTYENSSFFAVLAPGSADRSFAFRESRIAIVRQHFAVKARQGQRPDAMVAGIAAKGQPALLFSPPGRVRRAAAPRGDAPGELA
jgi:hypothetical protein